MEADRRWSYAELDEQASRMAARLSSLGVQLETPVAICLPRSLEAVASMLAVLKAGGCYVPLDPHYPPERLAFLVADSGARIVITNRALRTCFPAHSTDVTWLYWDDAPAVEKIIPVFPEPNLDNLAYIMYTSGSTGQPKGVEVTHRAIVRLLINTDFAHFGPDEVFLHLSPESFDASTLEIWGPLLHGGRCVLLQDRVPTVDALHAALSAHGVTSLFLTTSLFHTVVEQAPKALAGLRQLMFGGEILSTPHAVRAFEELPDTALLHVYGPTENTVFTTCHRMTAADCQGNTLIPIGQPIANTYVYILDERMQPVPPGAPGELYIGGDGLARGYRNRPDLTTEAFIPDPFSDTPGARLYRSGDIVRCREDGLIEFLGRRDNQVKIRGHRIELGEIETTLMAHPAVKLAAVVVRELGPQDKRLVAYCETSATPSELRAWLAAKLPEYLIPNHFVALDHLPRLSSGKIDRNALSLRPLPASTTPEHLPRTPAEQRLTQLFAEILRTPAVGIHDNFFELGGHSLLAMQCLARLAAEGHFNLSIRQFYENPTVAAIAATLDASAAQAVPSPSVAIPRHEGTGPFPASSAQTRLWLEHQLNPLSPQYNLPYQITLRGALDVGALRRALEFLAGRHEPLRTVFSFEDGRLFQFIRQPAPLDLETTEIPERELDDFLQTAVTKCFDLSRDLPWRAQLIRLSEQWHVLALVFHHIAFDGWSVGVFCEELSRAYAAYRRSEEPSLPPQPVRYADYAVWEQERLAGDESIRKQLEYWKLRLVGLPEQLDLPLDRPRPATPSRRGGVEPFSLPPALVQKLLTLSRRQSASFFMTVLAAFQVLLGRWSGQEDIATGVPTANRAYPQIENLIGFFVNTLVLRSSFRPDTPFLDFLDQVRQSCFEAFANQDAPFDKVVETLRPARTAHHAPLFQAMFALQNAPSKSLHLEGLETEIQPLHTGASMFDLTLSLEEHGEGLRGHLVYNSDIFEPATARRLLDHYRLLLEAIAEDPARPVGDLPLMSPERRRQILVDWNATQRPYPQATVAELFQAQAARTPEACAAVQGSRRWSYAELNQRANAWAVRLRELGVGPDVPVGLCLERSLEMLAAMLAVLKAGGAYVPLDPEYPPARLGFLAADAGVRVIITERRFRSRFPALEGAGCLELEDLAALPPQPQDPPPQAAPDHLAYILYTSGSTGQPKGVEIPHRAIVRLLFNTNYARFGPEEIFLHLSPESFDAATLEIWGPLLHGGCCVLYPDRLPTPAGIREAIAAHRVTSMFLTTSLFHTVVDESPEILSALRQLMFGGEMLSTPHAVRAFQTLPDTALLHVYGPTENTVFTTFHRMTAEDGAGGAPVPIGRPIAHTTVYVLDERMQPVPPGLPGELYIGGDGLARGYRNRPELTGESFIPDPFSPQPSARLYRSGDIVRWREDGVIEFLGRRDDQVKIRGHRIELGEIESALLAQRGVTLGVVVVREFGPNDKRLVAYYEGPAKPADVRNGLKARLPEYMVPNHVIALDSLPRLQSGKVDRRALAQRAIGTAAGAPARVETETELIMARLFAETLRLPGVDPEESFFDLGGHSLLAAQLMTRIEAVLGVQLPPSTLFGAPSVRELARVIAETRQAGSVSGLVPLRPGTSGPPVFFIHGMDGSVWMYRGIVSNLTVPNPVIGVEARNLHPAGLSMESLAAHHLSEIRKQYPHGPYMFCGYSYGGLVAHEMARQWKESGGEVALLAVVDSSPYAARRDISRYRVFVNFTKRFRERIGELWSGGWPVRKRYLIDKRDWWLAKIRYAAKRAERQVPVLASLGIAPAHLRPEETLLRLLGRYRPHTYAGDLVAIRAVPPGGAVQDWIRGWDKFVKGRITIHKTPGDHLSVIMDEADARAVAQLLSKEIEAASQRRM